MQLHIPFVRFIPPNITVINRLAMTHYLSGMCSAPVPSSFSCLRPADIEATLVWKAVGTYVAFPALFSVNNVESKKQDGEMEELHG